MANDSKASSFKKRAHSNHPTENFYDSQNPGSPPNSAFSIAMDLQNQNVVFENKKFIQVAPLKSQKSKKNLAHKSENVSPLKR